VPRRILGGVKRSVAHVNLDIELDSDPIRGRIADAGGRERSFNGWIELVQEIEDARMGASSRAAPQEAEGGKD
jgi:hypothetical protein